MQCKALTYADGSWFCKECNVGGDADEPTDVYCPRIIDKDLYEKRPSRAAQDRKPPETV